MTATLVLGAYDPPVNPTGYTRVLFVEQLEYGFSAEIEWIPCAIELPATTAAERSTAPPFRLYNR